MPLLVWAATGSPHMQQVVLGETRIFHELFGGIPVRPASFWGTANLLISLLEDMTVSPPNLPELCRPCSSRCHDLSASTSWGM